FPSGDSVLSSPIIDGNGIIYFGSTAGYFYALYPNGSLKWKFRTYQEVYSSAAIDNDNTIYFASENTLYSIGNIPPSPVRLAEIISDNGFVSLEWELPVDDGGAEILNFNVYRNTTDNETELIATIPSSETSFNDTDVVNGVEYSYWISAVNREGESELAGPFNAIPRGPPLSPLNISVDSGPAYLNISWDEPLSDGGYPIECYRIYREENGIYLLLGESNETYFVDVWANPGVNYSYYVAAVNEYGEGYSSSTFWGMSIGAPPPPDIVGIERFDGALYLDWSMSLSGLDEYRITEVRIYRNGSLHAEISSDRTSFNDTGLVNGVNYTYRFSFVNIVGEGDLSREFTMFPAWYPTPPLNLSAWANRTQVSLSWNLPDDDRGSPVTLYRVYRRTGDANWTLLKETDRLSWIDTDVEPGSTYEYGIDCVNDIGPSQLSDPIMITIPTGNPPAHPVLNSVSLTDEGYIDLKWDHPGASGIIFRIYRSESPDSGFVEIGHTDRTEYVDGYNLILNRTYYYYVTASNEFGESQPSNVRSIFIPSSFSQVAHPDGGEKELPIYVIVILAAVILMAVVSIIIFVISIRRRSDKSRTEPFSVPSSVTSTESELSLEQEIFGEELSSERSAVLSDDMDNGPQINEGNDTE
ncbi:MAG: hypothetical protein DRI88_13790, partial [Bacteroidetes bacterium]